MSLNRRLRWLIAAVTTLIATSSCASNVGGIDSPEPADDLLGHVHGLGVDPGDGALYVASHFGVFRFVGDSPERVADRWQDTMGFTIVGPSHFLASGHPDMRENLPPQLGLIESRDGAESWETISLQGTADFHALEATEERLWAFDAARGRLLTSTRQGRTWEDLGRHDIVDLAADPAAPKRVLATTPTGLVDFNLSIGDPIAAKPLDEAPPLAFIDWPDTGDLVGIAPAGVIYRSADGGKSWLQAARAPGEPHAFDATADVWHVATTLGVHRSEDQGRSWDLVTDTG